MYYINAAGKMVLASLGALMLSKAAEKYIENRKDNSQPNTLGLPQVFYDELKGHVFTDDRKAYMEALNREGAPSDISFRMDLWKALGGK